MSDIQDKFKGFHHAYLGIFLIIIGFIGIFYWYGDISFIIILLGITILMDDVYQHYKQLTDINYHSPLHKLYINTLYKLKIVRIINEFFDKVFKGE